MITKKNTTAHYRRVREMMKRIPGQDTPDEITIPDKETRILRAKLIVEEAFETVRALGVELHAVWDDGDTQGHTVLVDPADGDEKPAELVFRESEVPPDLEKVADGCADLSVVTMGTLVAFGIPDRPLLREVDRSNMSKFEDGYLREDGKWIKGPNWSPPDIKSVLSSVGGEVV